MTASRRLKKGDFWLIGGLLFLAALLFACSAWWPKEPGATVCVMVDDKRYAVYPLGIDTEADILTPYGHNRLVIRDGAARIVDADCPQQICVRRRAIRASGEVIVCLPHRVVVTVEGGDRADVDAIT